MGLADSIDSHLRRRDPAPPQHIRDILRKQIAVCDDPRFIRTATLLGKRYEASRKRLYNARCKQRLATEPGDGKVLRAGGIQHALRKRDDVILDLPAHHTLAVVFKAIRAIEIAAYRRTDGERDPGRLAASDASHGLDSRPLVEIRDDAALGETLDDGMVLVELFQHGQQVKLDGRVLGAASLEQIGNRHHLRAGDRRHHVVTRDVPTSFARRARSARRFPGGIFVAHLCLLLQDLTPLRIVRHGATAISASPEWRGRTHAQNMNATR